MSKRMAYVLRHNPAGYGVSIDDAGWVDIGELLSALRRDLPWVERWHIEAVALLDRKGRYEVRGGRVRARYGHSIPVKVEPLPGEAPRLLYHGTVRSRLGSILSKGILPMGRTLVHLSSDYSDAVSTGRRHGRDVVVLVVDVECLKARGLRPARKGKTIYTVEHVPPECIRGVLEPD